jgi:hypothetical protein
MRSTQQMAYGYTKLRSSYAADSTYCYTMRLRDVSTMLNCPRRTEVTLFRLQKLHLYLMNVMNGMDPGVLIPIRPGT